MKDKLLYHTRFEPCELVPESILKPPNRVKNVMTLSAYLRAVNLNLRLVERKILPQVKCAMRDREAKFGNDVSYRSFAHTITLICQLIDKQICLAERWKSHALRRSINFGIKRVLLRITKMWSPFLKGQYTKLVTGLMWRYVAMRCTIYYGAADRNDLTGSFRGVTAEPGLRVCVSHKNVTRNHYSTEYMGVWRYVSRYIPLDWSLPRRRNSIHHTGRIGLSPLFTTIVEKRDSTVDAWRLLRQYTSDPWVPHSLI